MGFGWAAVLCWAYIVGPIEPVVWGRKKKKTTTEAVNQAEAWFREGLVSMNTESCKPGFSGAAERSKHGKTVPNSTPKGTGWR
jgi:hypothetical protein